jgi:cobalamin-dependent methionine synthase I
MLIVGERINTSRRSVNEAVNNRDGLYIQTDVKAQLESGADWIDVNAGSRRGSEVEDLSWLIGIIQSAVPAVRLCLDSQDPDSLKAVLDRVDNPPMLNSTTAERGRFEAMKPAILERECDIVALCMDERGVPRSAAQSLENARRLVSDFESLGVGRERIYLDPIIQAVGANTQAAVIVFETIEGIQRELPGVHVICGLSNISYGLPRRSLVNRAFLSLAMKAGLDAAIVDPLDEQLMGTLKATEMLLGRDPWCQGYTRAFRGGRLR